MLKLDFYLINMSEQKYYSNIFPKKKIRKRNSYRTFAVKHGLEKGESHGIKSMNLIIEGRFNNMKFIVCKNQAVFI